MVIVKDLPTFRVSHTYTLTLRIAIVDWDVHHGNGTEKIFENDPRYYPGTADADPTVCGSEDGLGRTVQVAWNGRHVKDGEYIAVFVHIILPILYEFRPQLILVSAGFDAARGDRLGGLGVSPECFAHLTHLLLTAAYLCPAKSVTDDKTDSQISTPVRQTRHRLAQQQRTFTGGLILALEGGYHLAATAEAMCHSVASLLGDCCPRLAFGLSPTEKRGPEPFCSTAFYYFSSNLCVDGGVEPSDEVYAHKKRIGNQFKVMEYFGFIVTLRFALRLGPVRGQLITDESGRLSGSSEHHIGSQSALAFTGQLETEIQSRLEDLSLSDGASRSVGSPLSHPAAPISPSFSLAVTSPIGIGSVSTSVPTNGVAARVPAATEQETLQDLGTDLFNSHMSAGHVASTSVIPSSSSATLQGTVNLPQLIDEFTQMRVASPNTGQSDRSSLASDVPSPVQHRLTLTNAAGASGHAQSSSTPIASAGNQVVAIATLQDLMNVASIETEDMHAFFGLESSQQLPERLFAVTPLSWCPHLTSVHNNPEWNPNIRETCNRCTNQTENWVCLTCYSVRVLESYEFPEFWFILISSTFYPRLYSSLLGFCKKSYCYRSISSLYRFVFDHQVFCGRYANSHMVEHFTSTRHPLVLSFADLSSWCYECEAYVHNEALSEAKQTAHRAKFGLGCGRYANSHMLEHFSATQHPIVLSFADLSTWCYQCESYVNNEVGMLIISNARLYFVIFLIS
ncbi:Zn-finger in ubiquitin-hydrolase and other protein [Opisthorchis viverrini]|uniref:Zn-finger in ubiquitin-hydrolase and other protein n=1 Tax=Opisthorchis viverrini TaxID=6198 RepID=A0A1S8WGU0_OPIVI|nr:Zn-finger in ubiquitin-hydrolase and other protein [Opisthorchis viverrini]